MKKKYLLAFALSALAASGAFAQLNDTLAKAKAAGKVVMGTRESSAPLAYTLGNNQFTGYHVELCQRILKSVLPGVPVEYVAVTSANRIPLVQNGTVDIECGSTTNNTDRAKQVAFAINYFYTGTRFLVKADSGIKSLKDLKGKRVVTTAGTTNFQVLRAANQKQDLGFELSTAKDHSESALLVEGGRADAFGMDDILLYGLRAAAANPASLAVVGEPLQVEPYAIMFRKDDPGFKKVVDDTIASMMKSGEFTTLYRKWFESPIPPKGINLNAPMSKELKDNIKAMSDKPAL
jgi:glutamate/aspartate transport system substrate-binding protein